MKKKQKHFLASLAWAEACHFRNRISELRVSLWPVNGLSKAEEKVLARALHNLERAEEEIRSLQGSLSRKCKAHGHDRPAHAQYRRLRETGEL